jgi:hypothetical protein
MSDVKLVRYQMNPEPNFGPQKKATSGRGNQQKKRKGAPEETTSEQQDEGTTVDQETAEVTEETMA